MFFRPNGWSIPEPKLAIFQVVVPNCHSYSYIKSEAFSGHLIFNEKVFSGASICSINVLFQINEVAELVGDNMPTDAQTLSNMQQSINLGGLGNYAVNQSSVAISK